MDKIERNEIDVRGIYKHFYHTLENEWAHVSNDARELVFRMLEPDPNKRITIPEAIKHPWFMKKNIHKQVGSEVLRRFYRNVMSFKPDVKLFFQHATYAYIVHNLAQKEQIEDIRKFFLQLDKECLGYLTIEDIMKGLDGIIPNEDEKKFLEILKYMDQGNTGCYEYEEFTRLFIDKNSLVTDDSIDTTFKLLTKTDNKESSITPLEFKEILGVNSNYSNKVWDKIIKEIDINGDGAVSNMLKS